jgi:hypothetical protein
MSRPIVIKGLLNCFTVTVYAAINALCLWHLSVNRRGGFNFFQGRADISPLG